LLARIKAVLLPLPSPVEPVISATFPSHIISSSLSYHQ
jgi:hypothetical protein